MIEADIQGIGILEFPDGTDPATIQKAVDERVWVGDTDIDLETGAPESLRRAMGASRLPEDKLSTLKTYYPDAIPWGEDNFAYTNDEGKKVLLNPKGLDMGDIAAEGRMIFEYLGATFGVGGALIAGQLGPQVLAPEEFATVPIAAGLGAATGGKVYDAITDLFFPHVETRTMLAQTAEIGMDVLAGAIGEQAGILLGQGVKKVTSSIKGILKPSQPQAFKADKLYQAFERMGATDPSAGGVSGKQSIQTIESALSKLPLSGDLISGKYAKLLNDMGDYASDVASGISPVEGREVSGRMIKDGVQKFTEQFTTKSNILYNKVEDLIPSETKVASNSFNSKLDEFMGQFSDDPEFAAILDSPMVKKFKAATDKSIQKGGMSYRTLSALRTKIGDGLNDPRLIKDIPEGQLMQLYGALSDDMMRAAIKQSPEAAKAAKRASAFWSAGRSRISAILDPVARKAMAQDVFQLAMTGSKLGSERLRGLKKSVPKEDWDALVSTQIIEMGQATPGRQNATGELFSPNTFVTNYSKLSKDAQKTLFGGKEYKGLGDAIDDLVKTSEALKETAKMANTSGTAHNLLTMQILTGGMIVGGTGGALFGSPESTALGVVAGVAAPLVAPWATAKLITSPSFVKWLTKAADIPVTKNGIFSHLGLLSAMAKEDKSLEPAIAEYLKNLEIPDEAAAQ